MRNKINVEEYVSVDRENPKRTRSRLESLIDLGMVEVGYAQFGIPGIISGIYIERVMSDDDETFLDCCNWMKKVILEAEINKLSNNECFAKFLDWEETDNELAFITPFGDIFRQDIYDLKDSYPLDEYFDSNFLPEEMKFESEWNWIMLVVEKLSTIKFNSDPEEPDSIAKYFYPITFGAKDEDGLFMVRFNRMSLFKSDTLIDATYQACLEVVREILTNPEEFIIP